jgi:hypothetical protein
MTVPTEQETPGNFRPAIASGTIVRSANTTAYSAAQVVTNAAGGAVAIAVPSGAWGRYCIGITLTDENNPSTQLSPQLYVFSGVPTSLADAAAFDLANADIETLLLFSAIPTQFSVTNQNSAASGNMIFEWTGSPQPLIVDASGNVYVYVVSLGAYTPLSGEKFVVNLRVL